MSGFSCCYVDGGARGHTVLVEPAPSVRPQETRRYWCGSARQLVEDPVRRARNGGRGGPDGAVWAHAYPRFAVRGSSAVRDGALACIEGGREPETARPCRTCGPARPSVVARPWGGRSVTPVFASSSTRERRAPPGERDYTLVYLEQRDVLRALAALARVAWRRPRAVRARRCPSAAAGSRPGQRTSGCDRS